MINSIYGRLLLIDKVVENILNIFPLDFFCHLMTVLNIKDDFFDGDGPFYFRILDSRLVY